MFRELDRRILPVKSSNGGLLRIRLKKRTEISQLYNSLSISKITHRKCSQTYHFRRLHSVTVRIILDCACFNSAQKRNH